MSDFLSTLGVAVVVFASTNVDDILLLAAFFSDPRLSPRTVVAGQYLGIGALVLASAVAGLAALVIPEGFTALLGVVPLVLGVHKLWQLRGEREHSSAGGAAAEEEADEAAARADEQRAEARGRSSLLAVAGVTIANGGDNLGVYIPLFASAPSSIPIYVAVFAALTALWCLAGYALVSHQVIGHYVRLLGRVGLPFVLVALGLWILSGARVLLH